MRTTHSFSGGAAKSSPSWQLPFASRTLHSHPGASYGGIIVDSPCGIADAFAIVQRLVSYAEGQRFDTIAVRQPLRIYSKAPCEEIEFALTYLGFHCAQRELSTTVAVPSREEDVARLATASCARSTRKAIRSGVKVEQTERFAEYWKVLETNLLVRYNKAPTHSVEEIKSLKSLLPERVKLFGAFVDDQLVAGVVVFVCNDTAAHTFYFAQDYAFQHVRPVNLIVHEILLWAVRHKLRYLNFGISTESGGTAINWGLFRFKESFGGRGVLRDTLVLNLGSERVPTQVKTVATPENLGR